MLLSILLTGLLVFASGDLLVSKNFHIDWLSFMFICLVIMVGIVYYQIYPKIEVLGIILILTLCFSTLNGVLFYIFFEGRLLPLFYIILVGGKAPERMSAMMYFLIYTGLASFPLLVMLRVDFEVFASFYNRLVQNEVKGGFYCLCLLAFIVKLPIYGVHLWLPKAHVEAPTIGSMVLAALLLKLGVYGFIRFVVCIPTLNKVFWGWVISRLVLSSLVCFRTVDYKVFVAYSRIVHMSFVCLGFYSGIFTFTRFYGVVLIRLGHGFISRALFYFSEYYYLLVGSRRLLQGLGFLVQSGLLRFILFLSLMGKARTPPSLSLIGEIRVAGHIITNNYWFIVFFITYVFLVGLYNIYLFVLIRHGPRLLKVNKNSIFKISLGPYFWFLCVSSFYIFIWIYIT